MNLARRALHWIKVLGPGLITGAADDDPSGISTYSVAGASAGFSQLWFALASTPMMAVVQGMAARIGLVTGRGLTAVMRKTYHRWIVVVLGGAAVLANTLNAGADVGGMAASVRLVIGGNTIAWAILLGLACAAGTILFSYRLLCRVLKWLALSLGAYVITAFIVHPPWGHVILRTIVPEIRFNGQWLTTLVALFGTTISPYLFFWQAALMVEDEKRRGKLTIASRQGATKAEVADALADVNVGMTASNLAAFFIIVTTAATLGAHGIRNIETAQDAALALRPLAGQYAYLLFALGMVGTGLLAVPVLAGSSAYIIAEMFGFREGLDLKFRKAHGFYGVIIGSVLMGVLMSVFGTNPIRALFWAAVVNGVVAVPLLIVLTHICNRSDIMGRWTNSRAANFWAIVTIAVMATAAVLMFVFWNT